MTLKPHEMAQAMEAAFHVAWAELKTQPFPEGGAADRELLFRAISRGVLTYLENHPTDSYDRFTLSRSGDPNVPYTVNRVDLSVDLNPVPGP